MPKPFENPLIPNKLLREMYVAMLQVRRLAPRRNPPIPRGLEAVWTATAIGLRDQPGDLVLDPGAGPALDVLLDARAGARLKSLLAGTTKLDPATGPVRLPSPDLSCAPGAAMALRAQAKEQILLAYAHASDLTRTQWRDLLKTVQTNELPIVFVLLPEPNAATNVARLSLSCGLPAIPVDASDPIALYRVAQESIGRARAGGGPALIAATIFPAEAKRLQDPVKLLRGQLLKKQACSEGWLLAAEARHSAALPARGVSSAQKAVQ